MESSVATADYRLEWTDPKRYLWLLVRAAALDADGRVTLTVPAKAHGVRLRAHLLHGRNGWGEATSRAPKLAPINLAFSFTASTADSCRFNQV